MENAKNGVCCPGLLGEVEEHVDFVEVAAVLLEGVFLKAVPDEAKALVEANRGEIVTHDRQLEDFDALARGVNHGLNKKPRSAGAAMA